MATISQKPKEVAYICPILAPPTARTDIQNKAEIAFDDFKK
jgi:hypothetical protein